MVYGRGSAVPIDNFRQRGGIIELDPAQISDQTILKGKANLCRPWAAVELTHLAVSQKSDGIQQKRLPFLSEMPRKNVTAKKGSLFC